jgi:outer membrane protein OmpA-like peptidoglycan-associated protein/tetratricopeptide (TPR) repeat protein
MTKQNKENPNHYMNLNSIKICLLLVFLLGCQSSITAQNSNLFKTLKAVKSLKTAQRYINKNDFETAKIHLKKTIRIKKDFAVAHRELGKVYLMLNEFEEAVKSYETSFDLNSKLSRAAYYECGEAHFRLGDFETAAELFKQYEDLKGTRYTNKRRESDLETQHDRSAKQRRLNYQFALEAVKNPTAEQPNNLGGTVNSNFDEYLPSMAGNGDILIFTSEKTYSPVDMPTGENVFIVKKDATEWLDPVGISPLINSPVNEGMAKLAADERYMYFAACQRDDSKGGCDIYKATLDNYRVDAVRPLEGQLNSEFWDSQPSITCDGKTMYFSSSREGGYGGADIWVSFQRPDESWSEAVNLGPEINTDGDEEAPFIAPDGKTMYFASTGLPGMGDGDIFMTRYIKDGVGWKWTKPQNLGYPINSTFQEVGIYLKSDGYTAYLASSRLGGFGGLDIYEVELGENFQPNNMVLVEGKVTDNITGEPLKVEMDILREDDKWLIKSDENGRYFICLSAKQAYAFTVAQPSYEYFSEAAFLAEQDNSIPFRFDISLTPNELPSRDELTVEDNEVSMNFYFDFDDFSLNTQTRNQLEKLISKLKSEPDWEIEVIGYADNIGSSAYNQLLSEKRAQSIVTYLQDAGITVSKVRQEGRGAVSSSSIGGGSSSDKDRRVEVIMRK